MTAGLEPVRTVAGPVGRRVRFVLLMALGAALLFFDFGARVLVTNDEARFPVMAPDILTRGHWLLPEIDEVPMLNKPPRYAWRIALAAWPAGAVTQRTAALPSLLAALGLVAGTYWIGRRLFDADIGFTAGLIALTMAGVFVLARSPAPDMTLSLALIAAIGAFEVAESEGRRGAMTVFYLLVGLAFWVKGPVGLLPLAVALAYEVVTYGWSGPIRLGSRPGVTILALLVSAWSALALGAGRAEFVDVVVIGDFVRPYFTAGPWGRTGLLKAPEHALTILLPWSLLLPSTLWWLTRGVELAYRRGTRLALAWAAIVFVALWHRQRWRYYLPLCVPIALLVAAGLRSLRWRLRSAVRVSAWILVASGLAVGQAATTAREARVTDWRAIAEEAVKTPGPMFALDAPELVFEFYLGKPVLATPNYEAFAQRPEATLLLAPEHHVPSLVASGHLRQIAAGLVAGRHFVLLSRE